jgi:hypothetical protein
VDSLKGLEAHIKNKIPGFSIKYKTNRDSIPWWLKIAFGFVALFNKGFWTQYITTIGTTVWWTSEEDYNRDPQSSFRTLAHEYVHMHDNQRLGLWFNLGYLFPQLLGVLGFFGFLGFAWGPLFTLFLFLIAFAPLPAPLRKKFEVRGYTMSMATLKWQGHEITDSYKQFIVGQFVSSAYYFMWPYKEKMAKEIGAIADKIDSGTLTGVYEEIVPLV